jgi:hypothetical protein
MIATSGDFKSKLPKCSFSDSGKENTNIEQDRQKILDRAIYLKK